MQLLWIFNGANTKLPAAVFSSEELAAAWIKQNRLSGTLTQYPLDMSALDWATESGWFQPSKPHHAEPSFIQSFTSASQPHRHFTDGVADA
jgi:hypothetical protein